MPNIYPLKGRVVVRLHAKPEISAGGIWVGDKIRTSTVKEAEVVAVNKGSELKVGDMIMFADPPVTPLFDYEPSLYIVEEKFVIAKKE